MGNFHMKLMLCTPRQPQSSPIVTNTAVRHETAREVYSCCYLYYHKKICHAFTNRHSLCVVVFRLAQSPSPYDTEKYIDDDDDAHDDSNIIIQSDFCFTWTNYTVVDHRVPTANGSLSQSSWTSFATESSSSPK
jgi:hypothetical protein